MSYRQVAWGLGLSAALMSVAGGCTKTGSTAPVKVELTTVLNAMVKGGKGSGVVGGPVEGVEVTATLGDITVGPVLSDGAGSFSLDGAAFLPAGTELTQEALSKVAPVSVDIKFYKAGFKTQLEVVSFPLSKAQEITFYLTGT